MALQPQQPGTGQRRRGLRQLGLADPGRPFEQQRLVQAVREEQRVGDQVVGDVPAFPPQPLEERGSGPEALAHRAYQSGGQNSTGWVGNWPLLISFGIVPLAFSQTRSMDRFGE